MKAQLQSVDFTLNNRDSSMFPKLYEGLQKPQKQHLEHCVKLSSNKSINKSSHENAMSLIKRARNEHEWHV